MIDLTPIFQALIALIAAIITCKVIPWLKANTTESQYAQMIAVTRTLVFAAEQLYGAGGGEYKRDWVVDRLAERGYTVDVNIIEAMVRELASEGAEQKYAEVEEISANAKENYTDDECG